MKDSWVIFDLDGTLANVSMIGENYLQKIMVKWTGINFLTLKTLN